MDDVERELRDTLNDRVASMPTSLDAPPALLARARRRRTTKLTALAVSVVIIAGGAAGAVARVAGNSTKHVTTLSPAPPSVPTVVCPMESDSGTQLISPGTLSTTPPTPTAGDPDVLKNLVSYAAANDARFVVLGPKAWTCKAVAGETNAMGIISPDSGQSSTIESWPIAIESHVLSEDAAIFGLCGLFETPPPGPLPSGCTATPSPYGSVTRVSSNLATFVDRSGARGVGYVVDPSAVGGTITILTCRPTTGLTTEACDTIVADYVARLESDNATPPRPTVQTVACPVSTETRNGRPSIAIEAPNTGPRVARYGSARPLVPLQSFAVIDDPRYVVLGPEPWSCHGRVTSDANSIVVYDPNATPGQIPGVDAAPIAIENDVLWNDPSGALLACSVFDDPAVVDFTRLNYAENCLNSRSPKRTVTRINEHTATFVDANGDRGVGWMILPSSKTANDGKISVLTCRPTAGLAIATCDAIIADYANQILAANADSMPNPPTSTTTTTQPNTVTTVACPMTYALTDHATANPSTAPRVPSAGDPELFSHLESFAATDDPRMVALGPSTWLCSGLIAADGDNGMVIYKTAAPGGAPPDTFTAPVSIDSDYLWHGGVGSVTACRAAADPAAVQYVTQSFPELLPCPSAGRTVTRIDAHTSTFVDADGTRGGVWLVLPSSSTVDDGKIGVITCRATDGLTAADCDTIIGDWLARNNTTG